VDLTNVRQAPATRQEGLPAPLQRHPPPRRRATSRTAPASAPATGSAPRRSRPSRKPALTNLSRNRSTGHRRKH
jgi:hypothetical protein